MANNKALAIEHLKAMPSPLAQRQSIGPHEIAVGMNLYRAVEMDDSSLRMYRATKLAPAVKNPLNAKLDVRQQLSLLSGYADSFQDVDTYPEVVGYWVGASRLAQNILEDSSATTDVLIGLGLVQFRQLDILVQLVRKELMPKEKAELLSEELADRLDEIWKKVREQDPKRPESYAGASATEERRGHFGKALEHLLEGEKACTDKALMLDKEARLLQKIYEPEEALRRTERLVKENPELPMIYILSAQAAVRARRFDTALDICHRVQKLKADNDWAYQLEADILINHEEKPEEAHEASG